MGGGPAKAIANVTLQAAGALQVAGPVIVLANANNLGSGNLDAIADVDLTGNNVTVAGNVVVQATVAGRVAHSALADANLVLDGRERGPDQWQCGRGSPGQSLQGRLGLGP